MCGHLALLKVMVKVLPYSGLSSLGSNFPGFPEWTHNSGKFILGCCIKFDYGSLAELGVIVIFL